MKLVNLVSEQLDFCRKFHIIGQGRREPRRAPGKKFLFIRKISTFLVFYTKNVTFPVEFSDDL